MTDVVVAIPTFRRPRSLTPLLERLAGAAPGAAIVVADNDAERSEGAAVVQGFQNRGYPHPLEVIIVTDRGIVHARNALVAQALSVDPRFIAMIDDDELPLDGWLETLLEVQASTGAHVVGGPIVRKFEAPVPKYLENANNYGPGHCKTGVVELIDAAGNVLFDADVFRETPPPWFDPFFSLTGGEDKDFMTGLLLQGRKFAWADNARAEEMQPASRCSTRWALQRAFSTGNSDMLVNLKRRPPGFGMASESVKLAGAFGFATLNLALLPFIPSRRYLGLRLMARVTGKLSAVMGHRHLEYLTTHGS